MQVVSEQLSKQGNAMENLQKILGSSVILMVRGKLGGVSGMIVQSIGLVAHYPKRWINVILEGSLVSSAGLYLSPIMC